MATLVAAGERVTCKRPVAYPGLVKTTRETLPLKKGVETEAVWGRDVGVCRKDKTGAYRLLSRDEVKKLQPRRTPGCMLTGIGLDGFRPYMPASGPAELVDAILYRVFKKLPPSELNPENFNTARKLLDELVPTMVDGEAKPLTREQWLRSMPAARKKILRKMARSMEQDGALPSRWAEFAAFCKSEKMPRFRFLSTPSGEVPAENELVPRLIQPPNDSTHVSVGPLIKPLVWRLKEDWHCDNWLFYGSVCPSKLDTWINRVAPSATSWFWSDYSSFDSTYTDCAWDMIEEVYHRAYPDAPASFWAILREWRRPVSETRLHRDHLKVWYEGRTCNASGRDDTALANALLNGIVLALSFAAALAGKEVAALGRDDLALVRSLADITVVGDDSLVACQFDVDLYRATIERNIRSFGLQAKVCTSTSVDEVTYLGMMPYDHGLGAPQRYTWGPTIGRRFFKAYWMAEPDRHPESWLRGVAKQMHLLRNVPLLHESSEVVLKLTRGHQLRPVRADPDRVWDNRGEPAPHWTNSTLEQLCRRYRGLTMKALLTDLSTIRQIARLPAIVRLPSVELMLAQDDL